MDYIIGQRWVSHADAQLGLGIVVDTEGRRVTLAFPAVGEERTYATDNAPLTRLRFKAGDHISTVDNLELVVTEVHEQQGLLLYTGTDHHEEEKTVSELELDAFVQLTTPQQRLLNGHFDRFLSMGQGIGRVVLPGRQLDMARPVKRQQQAPADHVA